MGEEKKMRLVAARHVILFKTRTCKEDKDQEKYKVALESAGFTCTTLSALRFEFVKLDELRTQLQSPLLYAGLILTSPRCVEAIRLALEPETGKLEIPWTSSPAYCVGPATEQAAEEFLGLKNCSGSQTGNAEDLAQVIISCRMNEDPAGNSRKLLYPCSAIGRDSIARSLDSAGIKYQKISVYQTLPSEDLAKKLEECLEESLPEFLVFFSPSAFRFVLEELKRQGIEEILRRTKIAAIGPVTSRSIQETGLEVHSISDKPDPGSLVRALSGM